MFQVQLSYPNQPPPGRIHHPLDGLVFDALAMAYQGKLLGAGYSQGYWFREYVFFDVLSCRRFSEACRQLRGVEVH